MEWQPISTAPKDGRRVLVWNQGQPVMAMFYAPSNRWIVSYISDPLTPTHWLDIRPPRMTADQRVGDFQDRKTDVRGNE